MIDQKSTKIIFHSVTKDDGMFVQLTRKFVEDILECLDDRLEKIVAHNNQHEDQYKRIIHYRDQFMTHVTKLA